MYCNKLKSVYFSFTMEKRHILGQFISILLDIRFTESYAQYFEKSTKSIEVWRTLMECLWRFKNAEYSFLFKFLYLINSNSVKQGQR